jgi:hypothetical protein
MKDVGQNMQSIHYKPLSLPGSKATEILFAISLTILAIFSIMLIDGIWRGYDLGGFFRDVGPIALVAAGMGYLCFSFRIVISRDQNTVIVHRQFLAPQIQFSRREFQVDSLTADQVTYSGGEDGQSTTYTTLYNGEETVLKYTGHKRKLKHVLPELLMDKRNRIENKHPTSQEFWSDISNDS